MFNRDILMRIMRYFAGLLCLTFLAITPQSSSAGVEILLVHESIPVGHSNVFSIKPGTQSGQVATVTWDWRIIDPAPASEWFPSALNEVYGGIPGTIEVRLKVTYFAIPGMQAPGDEEDFATFTVEPPTHDDLLNPVDVVRTLGEVNGMRVDFKIFVDDDEMGGHHSHAPNVYVQELVQVGANPPGPWAPLPPSQAGGVIPGFRISSNPIKDFQFLAIVPDWDTANVGDLVFLTYQTHRIVFVGRNDNDHTYDLNTIYRARYFKHSQTEYRMVIEKYEEDQ